MPRIEVDDRATTGVARIYRTLFMITVFAYVLSPFFDDVLSLVKLQQAGALNGDNVVQAMQVSIKLNRVGILCHVLGCVGGVGLVMWQAAHDDASTFAAAPFGAGIIIGVFALLNQIIPAPEVDAVTKVILGNLKDSSEQLFSLATTFGTLGRAEYIVMTGLFISLGSLGVVIKARIAEQDAKRDEKRGQRPAGWGKTD